MSAFVRRANLTDKTLDLANFNRMVDWVNRMANMAVDQNMTISKGPEGFMIGIKPSAAAGEELDYSDYAFGLVASGNTVRVYNPSLQHDEFISHYASGTYTDVTVTSGTSSAPSYIVCKYIRKSSLTVENTTYATVPTPSIDYFWIPIATVYLGTTGLAVIKCRLVIGMIFFSGEI